MTIQSIRQPVVAGSFYPSDPDELRSIIRTSLEKVRKNHESTSTLWGTVVPHAGYKYSGRVAASAYQVLSNLKPERIILIGPSHREYFPGISVHNGTEWNTPLGLVNVATDFAEILATADNVELSERGHTEEHAIEVQLPFLQYIYPHEFSIVPITLGSQTPEMVEGLAEVLTASLHESDLIIASSDLSHYYSYDKACIMDNRFGELLESGDKQGLWKSLDRHEIEACGFGPVMVLLELAKRWKTQNPIVLEYANSGDVTGERNQVVGYLSAVFDRGDTE